MSLGNAIKFIKRFVQEEDFRKQCNKTGSKNELLKGHNFNENEFEDAINMQLLKCKTEDEAEIFHQVGIWLLILQN